MKTEIKMLAACSALTDEEEYLTAGGDGSSLAGAIFLVPVIMGVAALSVVGIRALYYMTTGDSQPSAVEQYTAKLAQDDSVDPAAVAQAASAAAINSVTEVTKNVGTGL